MEWKQYGMEAAWNGSSMEWKQYGSNIGAVRMHSWTYKIMLLQEVITATESLFGNCHVMLCIWFTKSYGFVMSTLSKL